MEAPNIQVDATKSGVKVEPYITAFEEEGG
jgi:hypothetical protein